MNCPACASPTRVIESRPAEGGAAVRRRRACPDCARRFTTYERREHAPAWVLKRSGERQPFSAEKLRGALTRSAHKRPVAPADIDAIVSRVEVAISEAGGELAAERVREMCLEGLGRIDAGAYLQFAGVELSDFDAVRAAVERFEGRKTGDLSPVSSAGSVRDREDADSSPMRTGSSKREESI